jgi:Arc/MetJ-type ribon-helix-helix transcriptional regulator
MPSIRVSESVKAIVDACVDDGAAPSAAAFVEEAVRHYADSLYNDDEAVIAAAEEGIAAIERGEYVTIATQADRDALWERVTARAQVLFEEIRANDPSHGAASHIAAHAAE